MLLTFLLSTYLYCLYRAYRGADFEYELLFSTKEDIVKRLRIIDIVVNVLYICILAICILYIIIKK